jgi:TolB-like protein
MRGLLSLLCIAVFIAVLVSSARADEAKSIAVVGFINQGEEIDDSVNKVISKSLITFLGKIRDVRVVSYEAVEKIAQENNFWKSKKLIMDQAVEMGLDLAVKQVVTGTYKINKKNGSILIIVQVIDPATSELKLKREYTGDAGPGIFDTIDRLIRNISTELVGHPVLMGSLEVDISADTSYNLLINKVFQKKLTKQSHFTDIEESGEPLEVSLTIPETGFEVYHETITLKDGENRVITYSPSGTIFVKAGIKGVSIIADGSQVGETDIKGELVIRMLKAGVSHTIRAEKDGKVIGVKTIMMEEGRFYIADFSVNARNLYYSVHALQGMIGATAGVDYYFTEYLRASVHAGGGFLYGYWGYFVPVADLDIGLEIWKINDLKIFAGIGGFSYFVAPYSVSPDAWLEIS